MKKFRIIISVLIVLILFFGATGCNTNSGSDDAYVFTGEHFVEGTIHKVNITENKNREFIANQKTDYVMILPDDGQFVLKAASLIMQNVKRATNANLPMTMYEEGMETSWSENDKLIVLNVKPIFSKAGLTMPSENLGDSGYYIKNVGNTVFIMCNEDYGYQMGAIKFLEAVLGYDMLGKECWYYAKDGKTMPDIDVIEKPDFDYRTPSNDMDLSTAYGMGYNMSGLMELFMTVKDDSGVLADRGQHTSFNILPPAIYCDENKPETYHPSWYYLAGNKDKEQLCYTARGAYKTAEEDRENGVDNEFNLMVDTAYEKCMRVIDDNPSKFILPVTIMDNSSCCDCNACREIKEEYGAISASNVIFLKAVDKLVQEDLQKRADESGSKKRKVWISVSAYNATVDAPAYLDENGKYQPIDEKVKLSETMCIDIAPINSYFNATLYDDQNMLYGESKNILAWSALCDNMLIWLYQDNFLDYFAPYNTYDSSIVSYRFCYEAGAVSMFNQGQTIMKEPTNFTKFKDYINAKAYVNVNLTYKQLEDNYFSRYFLDAKEPMFKFFKEMQSHLEFLEKTNISITGKIYNPLINPEHFAVGQLNGWLAYIEEAYKLVEKYKIADTQLYEMLSRHILVESLFPRYLLLQNYTSIFTKEQEITAKKQFKSDCDYLGNTGWGENASKHQLTQLWQIWGV